ncbi:hypothetical protein [Leptotrichia trevisanii]|uniref:hypothetical protein n=1 Tax=Leptotrichia trevisanii TaxID=109328 RepID=UPI0026EBD7A8|nr:hypothetical protein [Leptotrichia trevisanii]
MYLVKEKNLKNPVLYLEKFPNEFKNIMNLGAVKNGFSNGLESIGNNVENAVKKIKMQNGSIYSFNEKKKIPINLILLGGSTDWGRTHLRINVENGQIKKIPGGYEVTIKYETHLFDEFLDVKNIGGTNNRLNQELKDGKPYNVATKGITTTKTFKIKDINELSNKMKGFF